MPRAKDKLILKAAVLSLVLVFSLGLATSAQAMKITSLGYKPEQTGGGGWTGGNLGKTWAEGEWVPYQLVLEDVGPGLAELDSIVMSFDFNNSGHRFIDLVRGIQVGTTRLGPAEAWPKPDGSAFPVGTRAEIEIAQNHPLENVWSGFAHLNLPNEQVNRTMSGALDVPPGEGVHIFKVYKSDLLAAGIDINEDTVVVYYQLHESRTFIWQNRLQTTYDAPPTDGWGGYLYGTDAWDTVSVLGSGYVPGASGHVHLEAPGTGQTIPIPIPEEEPGTASGLKWRDDNGNGVQDGGEPLLSGWQIHVSGTVDGAHLSASTLTDGSGEYLFLGLTAGTWTIKEDQQRDDPAETGYAQTYPTAGMQVGQGTAVAVGPPPPDAAPVGWEVALTLDIRDQADMNFGNQACNLLCDVIFDYDSVCAGFDASFTAVALDGTPPYTYEWSGPAGFTATTATIDIADAQPANAGNYQVIMTDAFGCVDTCNQDLTVHPKPNCQVTPDGDAVCAGSDASFTANVTEGTPPFTYDWTGPGGFSGTAATIDITDAQSADAGTYEVIVTDFYDCADTASVELTVYTVVLTPPADDLVHAADKFVSTDFFVSAGNGFTVTVCGITPSPTHQPSVVGDHVEWQTECADDGKTFTICLEAVDDFECKDTAYFDVTVYNGPPQLTCPDDGHVRMLETFVSTDYSVSDPDGDPTQVAFLDITPPATNDPTLVGNHVEWVTTLAEPLGDHIIRLVATDHCGLADTCEFTVTVDLPTGDLSCPEDDSAHPPEVFVSTDFTLTGPGADPSLVSIVGVDPPPTNVPFIVASHVEWQTACPDTGKVFSICLKGPVPLGEDTCCFEVTVYNRPPQLFCPEDAQVYVADLFVSTDYRTFDPDGDEVVVSILDIDPCPCTNPYIVGNHLEWQTTCCDTGSFYIRLVGVDPCGLADTCGFWVTISDEPSPDFYFLVAPVTQYVSAGKTAQYVVEMHSTFGFDSPCSLYVSGLPNPPNSADFGETVLTPTDWTMLNVHTTASTPLGIYILTITGKQIGESLEHDVTVFLEVQEPTDVEDQTDNPNIPRRFALFQNQPNPFNPVTQISYQLPEACQVRVIVYDLRGQKVRTIVDGYQEAGYRRIVWDGRNDRGDVVASGIYFYKIKAGDFVDSKKMVILK
ncbi:MAG: T9SS type A sorting domain-containing protein [Candidatus Zixiibacteriota bacterium]|nr:MAG: T9SS type A sorting domain-containing protein [candidate division Zixibacteria bacterium]